MLHPQLLTITHFTARAYPSTRTHGQRCLRSSKLAIEWIVEILFIWIGEAVLWVVTLGRHHPNWSAARQLGWGAMQEISFWIGLIFWIAVAAIFNL